MAASAGPEIERLIGLLSKLPGLGPRSARRAALALLKRRDQLLLPLSDALSEAAARVKTCSVCGSLDTQDPCAICSDGTRDASLICVVEEVGALWAMERAGAFRGRYHVLHGSVSPIEGIGPEKLKIQELIQRVEREHPDEVILATNLDMPGEATASYLHRLLAPLGVNVTRPASGLPAGGDLEYADEITLGRALQGRRTL